MDEMMRLSNEKEGKWWTDFFFFGRMVMKTKTVIRVPVDNV